METSMKYGADDGIPISTYEYARSKNPPPAIVIMLEYRSQWADTMGHLGVYRPNVS